MPYKIFIPRDSSAISLGADKVYQEIPTEMECMYTTNKDRLDDSKISARIEGNLLDPFKENPYTQSLASFAY